MSGGWNATFVQNGTTVTASNPAGNWNGTIGTGVPGAERFRFQTSKF